MNTLEITRRKNRTREAFKKETVTISMSPELINKIDDFCYAMRINRSVFMSRAAERELHLLVMDGDE